MKHNVQVQVSKNGLILDTYSEHSEYRAGSGQRPMKEVISVTKL